MQRFIIVLALLFAACGDDHVDPAGATDATGTPDAADTADAADTSDATDTTGAPDSTGDSADADTIEVDAQPGLVDVTFVVTVPPGTPEGDTIHVCGNLAEIGAWETHVPLYRAQDGLWRLPLLLAPGTAIEFKVTRGSWETVEKGADGEEIANRTYYVTSMELHQVVATVATWRDLVPVPPGPPGVEFIRGVSSQFLEPDRDIIIYLPPGYTTETTRRYPVLYMHDGQNLMDAATTPFGTAWEVDDTATALIGQGRIEPLIVVGIYNTDDRFGEYTPAVDSERGGDAESYKRFVVEELKPDIDATYRTRPEAAATGVAGSSLGGLASMYFGLVASDTFSRIGVVSPSVWWADRDIVDRVEALTGKLPLRVWLDIGTSEGGGESVEDTRLLRDALVGEGWVLGQDLFYREYPGAGHNEAAWAARTDDILEALFPP